MIMRWEVLDEQKKALQRSFTDKKNLVRGREDSVSIAVATKDLDCFVDGVNAILSGIAGNDG